ncbi:MAG: PepSY domain-containing protein [Gammaproteobacteria bacterium]|nr:PepSY domain-containing protein [Gammaproteobacteria bacterium]
MSSITSTTLLGDEDLHPDLVRQWVSEGRILPLATILGQHAEQLQGTILDVELEEEDGVLVYEIKILDPRGHRWEHYFSAADGAPIKKERD